jgi:hypothetical protein
MHEQNDITIHRVIFFPSCIEHIPSPRVKGPDSLPVPYSRALMEVILKNSLNKALYKTEELSN